MATARGAVAIWGTGWRGQQGAETGDVENYRGDGEHGCVRLWRKLLSTASDDYAFALAVDVNGDIYVAGRTGGDFVGNALPNDFASFAMKYTSAGDRVWVRELDTGVDENISSIALDSASNLIVAGYTNADYHVSSNGNDYLLAKLDSTGEPQWINVEDSGNRFDYLSSVAIDANDDIYVTGSFFTNAAAGDYDGVLTKYDAMGEQQWLHVVASPEHAAEDVSSIVVDSSDNLYIVGSTGGVLAGGPSLGVEDVFLMKLDAMGQTTWTQQPASARDDRANDVSIDADGNLFVTGGILVPNDLAGQFDVTVTKYDNRGEQLWQSQFGADGDELGSAIAIDAEGNSYVVGNTNGDLVRSLEGYFDGFIVKFDPLGARLWARQLGNQFQDGATAVALDSDGNVLVAGYSEGGLDGSGSEGNYDAFILKLNTEGEEL